MVRGAPAAPPTAPSSDGGEDAPAPPVCGKMLPVTEAPRELPARALETSAQRPWPVRVLSQKITRYIDRMPPVWVEGQVVQLNRRGGISFLTLRDTATDMSLPVSAPNRVLATLEPSLEDGSHVVLHAKPVFWPKRGVLQLEADEIRPVGVGELLARIEHLKRVLAAEGLFAPERKVALPFLPGVVGLICGRESKAKHDVVVTARARWPEVIFEIREVAVQGGAAVAQVSAAIAGLDADPRVDVIVVARGGGSVEDLLPFSNEALLRAAAACRTPIVSAIGHETDSPLLDLVADVRASTPTDAGKRIVPDVAQEALALRQARTRIRNGLAARLDAEQDRLDSLRARPALAEPERLLTALGERLAANRAAARAAFATRLDREDATIRGLTAQVRMLSPAATLARGYAVLRTPTGAVVRSARAVGVGDPLEALLAAGHLEVCVTATHPTDGAPHQVGTPAPAPVDDSAMGPSPVGT